MCTVSLRLSISVSLSIYSLTMLESKPAVLTHARHTLCHWTTSPYALPNGVIPVDVAQSTEVLKNVWRCHDSVFQSLISSHALAY